ncbi:MAG: PD-(D/E)XK nuclease family protein [Candidatus Hodarchaeales archaeon]
MIREVVLQHIAQREKDPNQWHSPHDHPFDFHASEVGESCLRKLYFKRTILLPFRRREKSLLLFETGNVFHWFLQSLFPENETERPVRLKFKEFNIIGRADLVHNGEIYEFKAVSSLPSLPYEIHECQVEVYMRGLRKKTATIVYVKKTTFDTLEFQVQRDDLRWKEICLKVRKVVEALKNKVAPEPNFSPSCRWCPYYSICRKLRYF